MDINTTQILFQLVNFSVVLGALTYFLYNPILEVFEERARRVAEGQKAAENALASQEEIESLKQAAIDEGKKKQAKVLKEARAQAKTQAGEIVAAAEAKAKDVKTEAQSDWKKELTKLRKGQKQEISELAVSVAGAALGSSMDKKTASKLIDSELDAILKTL